MVRSKWHELPDLLAHRGLDGFLGFLALAIAFYAIISPVARLRAQLHLVPQVVLAVSMLVSVLYLQFFPLLGQPCLLPGIDACRWITFRDDGRFTPQQAAFLIVLLWMFLALVLNALLKPSPRAFPAMAKIVQTLLLEQRFAELLDFIRPHIPLIASAAERRRPAQRLHDWLADGGRRQRMAKARTMPAPSDDVPARKPGLRERFYFGARSRLRWSAKLVPAGREEQAEAERMVRMLLRSEELRKYAVTMRPDALPDLMSFQLQPRFDFADKVMRELMLDSGSRLYQEIEDNQNLLHHGGYVIPEDNAILKYLFADANVACDLGAWKPVGDAVIAAIKGLEVSNYSPLLSLPGEPMHDEWRDIGYVGIRFFDIMVHAAISQNVANHMWLFYMQHFVEELEKVYDTSRPGIDEQAEFPIRSSRLIYEAFDAMGDWLKRIQNLSDSAYHAKLPAAGEFSTNVIPAAAAAALGNAMVTVALSSKIGDDFAQYIHDCVMRDIAVLKRAGNDGRMRAMLVRALASGGNRRPDLRIVDAFAISLR